MIRRLIKRVVVTGVGTPPAKAVVHAFKRRGWLVVGVDTEFHPHQVNQFYLVSSGERPGFVDEMLMLVRREQTKLVITTRESEWLPIARRAEEFRRLGAGVYLPNPATVEDLSGDQEALRTLRRLGIRTSDTADWLGSVGESVQWFEATVCRDGRLPHAAFVCSVHELTPAEHASSVRAERRKGELEIEDLTVRTAEALGLRGPASVRIRRDADRAGVAGVKLRPCEHAPPTDDVLDAFLALWERDQPS